ncbi:MAG: right-handed parallel beta-helix repeat-containing protein [Kiritimatiellae bacterium]|nr:right-handed parallel beta-helix repeat-containing protein [Kiritimatiellia bacterium]
MNVVKLLALAQSFSLSAVAAIAADIYVSPDGDDSADGSPERPFATVARARDAVRSARKSGALPKGGVNVWLRGGEYSVRETLAFGAEDSGTADAPVAYRAWKGETPVFTGAWTVPPSAWRNADDPRIPAEAKGKVWVADVKSLGYDALEPDALCGFHTARPKFRIRSLTCDGKRLTLARHPNTGFLRTGTVVDRAGVFKADLGDMTRWSPANAPCLEALGYWRWLWADQTLPAAVDPAARTISLVKGMAKSGDGAGTSFHLSQTSSSENSRYSDFTIGEGHPFYLQNALAALDAPGEWHLDRTTGILYVYPEEGGPRGRYELSLAARSLVAVQKASHLRFAGIEFRGGRHHGVEMRGVSHVKVERCEFRDFGGHGLVLDSVRDSLVRGCSFRTFGHSAMTLDGGDRKALAPSGVTIDSCDFSDTGLAMRTYTPGIWVTGCGHRIVRNHFHDLPSSALRVGGNEHLVASNLVERVVLESDDQGAVDMWGDPTYRGNRFIHNIFRDVGRGGAFVRCGQGGIRFDDAISGNLVYGNRFDNCSKANFGGVQIHGGRDNVVRNNVFTRCRYGITVSPWSQDHWRKFLSGERGKTSRAEANVEGAAFKAKYPEFASALDAPMRNTFECNVYEGDEKSFTRRAPAPTVMRGNVCVEKLPDDLSSVPGFEPLPPESAIGPAKEGVRD